MAPVLISKVSTVRPPRGGSAAVKCVLKSINPSAQRAISLDDVQVEADGRDDVLVVPLCERNRAVEVVRKGEQLKRVTKACNR